MAHEDDTYWLARTGDDEEALKRDAERIGGGIERHINRFADRMLESGRAAMWQRSSRLYFSRDSDTSLRATSVQIGGKHGELIGTRGNLYGRYHRAVNVLVTGSRPSAKARSIGSSAQGISQSSIGDALMDFSLSKRGAEAACRRAEMFAQIYGQGWVSVVWDERAGKPVGVDQMGRMRFTGDLRVVAKRPDEVVYDVDLDETSEHEFVIVARQFNRWKLIGQFPQMRDHLLEANTSTKLEEIRNQIRLDGWWSRGRTAGASENIVVGYELHAPPSSILPDGCYALWVAGELIALDKALYDDLAHYECTPEYEPGTRNGHSFMWDLCGPQQVSDSVLSSIITTVENYGKPVLHQPTNSKVNVSKDAMMMPYAVVGGDVPPSFVSLDAAVLAPLITARAEVGELMTSITGLNDAALGDAGKSQSGEALATMHSLALQSVSSLQASYADCFAATMFGVLKRYRRFATVEMITQIAGNTYAQDARVFKASLSIEGVDVEMGAAAMRHSAGRKEYADKLFGAGVVTPEQYLEAQATGKVEPILERPRSQRALIETENELLRGGQSVPVSIYDDHRHHIWEHTVVLDNVAVRMPNPDGTPNIVQAVTDEHIQGHLAALRATDVDLANVLAKEPLPSVAMQMQANAMAQQNGAQPAPNMQGPVATGANGGLPPNGNDGADVAATDMPMQG
jgi:hypothetical protein